MRRTGAQDVGKDGISMVDNKSLDLRILLFNIKHNS